MLFVSKLTCLEKIYFLNNTVCMHAPVAIQNSATILWRSEVEAISSCIRSPSTSSAEDLRAWCFWYNTLSAVHHYNGIWSFRKIFTWTSDILAPSTCTSSKNDAHKNACTYTCALCILFLHGVMHSCIYLTVFFFYHDRAVVGSWLDPLFALQYPIPALMSTSQIQEHNELLDSHIGVG